jgi:cold shock CspA family protein
MKVPIQVTFHNMSPAPEIEDKIRAETQQLEEFCPKIVSCRVVVDVPHKHHRDGNLYQVRIDLKVPGDEFVIKCDPGEHVEYRVLDIAIRDAFDEARRVLEEFVRQRRGHVKTHEPNPHARVVRLFGESGYGFLETPDGREIYFHKNSVLNGGFRHLRVGTEVRFVEEEGEKGPQASTVSPVGRHSHLA